jgi:hypothetical protein
VRFGTRGECFDLLPKYNTKAWNTVTNLIEILLLKLFSDLYLQSTVNWEKRSGKTAQENNSFGTENNFGSQISTRLQSLVSCNGQGFECLLQGRGKDLMPPLHETSDCAMIADAGTPIQQYLSTKL